MGAAVVASVGAPLTAVAAESPFTRGPRVYVKGGSGCAYTAARLLAVTVSGAAVMLNACVRVAAV